MSRSKLLVVAFALGVGGIGCAHCTTCDEFPTSCAAGGLGYAPTGAIAAGPSSGPYVVDGPILDYAVPSDSPLQAAPAPSTMTPSPTLQPGPFTPPTPSAPAERPTDPPPSLPTEVPTAPPVDLDQSLPEPGGPLVLPIPGETP